MTEELRDKAENERNELQLENDNLKEKLQKLVDLRSEHENLKRKNKMTEELRDEAEDERDELQLQNDILKNKLQKLKHLILTKF